LFYQAEQIASPCQHGPLDRALSLIARLHAPGA
jgi:hypothetical protein